MSHFHNIFPTTDIFQYHSLIILVFSDGNCLASSLVCVPVTAGFHSAEKEVVHVPCPERRPLPSSGCSAGESGSWSAARTPVPAPAPPAHRRTRIHVSWQQFMWIGWLVTLANLRLFLLQCRLQFRHSLSESVSVGAESEAGLLRHFELRLHVGQPLQQNPVLYRGANETKSKINDPEKLLLITELPYNPSHRVSVATLSAAGFERRQRFGLCVCMSVWK